MMWLLFIILAMIVYLGFTLPRANDWVEQENRFARINAEVCPVCAGSRVFYRESDGARMLAPPHPHVYEP